MRLSLHSICSECKNRTNYGERGKSTKIRCENAKMRKIQLKVGQSESHNWIFHLINRDCNPIFIELQWLFQYAVNQNGIDKMCLQGLFHVNDNEWYFFWVAVRMGMGECGMCQIFGTCILTRRYTSELEKAVVTSSCAFCGRAFSIASTTNDDGNKRKWQCTRVDVVYMVLVCCTAYHSDDILGLCL